MTACARPAGIAIVLVGLLIGGVLDYLDQHQLTENTVVIYTSDQGYFLGEHNYFDKRFMRWGDRIMNRWTTSVRSSGWIVAATMAAIPLSVASGADAAQAAAERLILGFEQAELAQGPEVSREEKPGRDSWFYLLPQHEGFDFAARFEWPGATNRAWTWRCRPGLHTQGELSLTATVGPAGRGVSEAAYRRTDFLSRFYPDLRENAEAHRLMTTFQWMTRADAALRDWSRYDLLWIDVRCEATSAELWLALEDEVLEPAVMRTYHIPADQWVTIELDLREAARTRSLELTKIANFWLLGRAPKRTEVRIDNVRIVKRGAASQHRLVRDDSPMTFTIARPERPLGPRRLPAHEPDRAPIQRGKPITVARGSVVPFGWVTAHDNRFVLLAYGERDGSKLVARATFSRDGGQTWQPLPDPLARNLDHGTARGCAVDVIGDGVAVSSGPGCAGIGIANPRQHLTKYTFIGDGWRAESPTILDADIRHCGSNASVVRLSSGPCRGRLWASWGQIGRRHRMDVHAKLSDDDGRTWIPWGQGAAIPGSHGDDWSDGTYGYPETVVTPYGNHVACFWRHKRDSGTMWSVFDGSGWSPPREVSPLTLNDMDGAYRATMSAVSKGDSEIFFTTTGMDTVMRWDGDAWSKETLRCEDGGMLCLAGDVVALVTGGKVNRRWKGIDWSRHAVLRCYQRSPAGQWAGPQDLTGQFNLHEYRSLAGFTVPPYAPANYVPLAWSDFDEGTVKFLRVPLAHAVGHQVKME